MVKISGEELISLIKLTLNKKIGILDLILRTMY